MESAVTNDPPVTLRIAAALFLAHGTFTLVHMAAGFLAQRGVFDVGILSLPLGFSLLRGSAVARICMLVLGALGLLNYAYLLVLIFTQGRFDGLLLEERMLLIVTLILGVSAVGLAWACLIDRNSREWCRKGSYPTKDVPWAIILIFILGAFSVLFEVQNHATRQLTARVFPIATTFRGVDIRDGKRLTAWAHILLPSGASESSLGYKTPKVTDMGEEDGVAMAIKGVIPGQLTIRFSSPGMQDLDYMLSPETPAQVTLQFKPLASPP